LGRDEVSDIARGRERAAQVIKMVMKKTARSGISKLQMKREMSTNKDRGSESEIRIVDWKGREAWSG